VNAGELILGIESAIGGGSLAIFENGDELASRTGETSVSRAEEILPNIDDMLKAISRTPRDLTAVIVSVGPGSFTGIRVGISTALGLCESLGIPCLAMTSLEAMACHCGGESVIAAVPMGRDMICIQQFSPGKAESAPSLISEEQFNNLLFREDAVRFMVYGTIFERFAASPAAQKMTNTGMNLASLLCRASHSSFISEKIHPLFVDRSAFTKSSA
jgi:tRNA threonylcarbamoyl adenosine modification protein YeaZ